LLGIYSGKKKIFSPSSNPVIQQKENTIRFSSGEDFITEYINSPAGVRQNFIIKRNPCADGRTVHVRLRVSSAWLVNKVHDHEIHFAKVRGGGYEKKLTYNDLKVWDANNKALAASFSVRADELSIDVLTTGAVYPIFIDPISTTANWTNESNQANSNYSWSLGSAGDVNGDGYSDVILGAPNFDNGQTDEGKVFVYQGSATGLSAAAAWTAESDQAGAYMGLNVNTGGDVNGDGYSDVIVGAPFYDNGQTDEGRAFVYYGSGSGLAALPAWTKESDQVSAAYGSAVASAGDVNGDGYSDVIVGAPYYDNGQADEGRAFVYHGSASGLSATPNWTGESDQVSAYYGGTASGNVGTGVASAGDVNGDGYSDVIIAASRYDNGQTDEGRAYVYHGSPSGLSVSANWTYENNFTNACLGNSLASAGDVNGDGYSDVIIGSFGYSNGQLSEGNAVVLNGSASGLAASPSWSVESNLASALYGCSVACVGDANADGYSDVTVGASLYTNGQANEGAAYAYFGSATGLPLTASWMVESNSAGAAFGSSLSPAGDVNGDGFSDIIVGARVFSNGQANEGGAFLYQGSAGGIITTASNILDINQALAFFGASVASAGDVNGDGYGDVIVGSGYFDNGQTDEGAAFVFHGSANGVTNTIRAQLEINQADARMGYSVSSAGDVNGDGYSDVIVGAYNYSNGQAGEGGAFVYHGSASGIINTIQAQLEINQAGASMGYSVSSAGDVNGDGYSDVVVGANWFSNGQSGEGGAFVYHGSAAGIGTTIKTQLESNQVNAHQGNSVAGAGDVNGDGFSDVIIGAGGFDNGQTDEGAAFVYHGTSTGISTTIQTQLECNQTNAYMGSSVASAGDVNGDSYCDVLVGAWGYDNGQTDEGMIFAYHGSLTGVTTTVQAQFESNQANAHMGWTVSSAGDLNGDGYSDIVISALAYANGETNEGEVLVYHGSPAGINTTVQAQMESNQTNAYMGYSVASAGDVNGDGYSDIIVGVQGYNNGQASEGAAFIYLGNKGTNKKNNLRLYNTDLTTPISHSNINNPNLFGAGLFSKSPLGRAKGRLVWEVKQQGQAFSGNPITNSVSYYDRQVSFTDMGIAGIELKNQVQKRGKQTKIRIRTEYSKATAITGQIYGPWKYPPGYTMGAYGMNAVPLPLLLIAFNGQFAGGEDVRLDWITAHEINVASFTIERSTDGMNFEPIGETTAKGDNASQAEYTWLDKGVKSGPVFYRLKIKEKNGDLSYSNTIVLSRSKPEMGSISPNPARSGNPAVLNFYARADKDALNIRIINLAGQLISTQRVNLIKGKNAILLETGKLRSGLYFVQLIGDGINERFQLIID